MLIAQSAKKQQLCNAKSGLMSMIKNTEEQTKLLEKTFRHMDQLDAERVQRWVSSEDLRPVPPKPRSKVFTLEALRKRSIEDDTGCNWPFFGG